MMQKLLICAAVCLLPLIACRQETVTKEDVLLTLDSLEHKSEVLDHRIMEQYWSLYTTGKADSLEFYDDLYVRVFGDGRTRMVLEQGKRLLSDKDDIRRWELIHEMALLGGISTDPSVSDLTDSLRSINIGYRAVFEGDNWNANDLYTLYRTEGDPTRREAAYRAYVSNGELLHEGLERLIRLRNQRARKLGYNNYLAMAFSKSEVEIEDYLDLLDQLEKRSNIAYDSVMSALSTAAGSQPLEIWDLGYALSSVRNDIDRYFPVDSQLVFVDRTLERIGIDMDKLPIYFDLESRPSKSQFAYAFPVKPPHDVRVLANLRPGLQSMRTLLHEMGHAIHSTSVSQNRALFNRNISGAWAEAVAQIMAGICDERNWLTEVAHVPAEIIDRHMEQKRRSDLIYLRHSLTRLTWELKAYTNPNQDLNKLYWDLFERFMSLPRHDDIHAWASVIHYTTHPVYIQNYLFADIVTAQTRKYLERKGVVLGADVATQSFLDQNYMRFGARYPWTELLERGTEESLNPNHLLKQLGI